MCYMPEALARHLGLPNAANRPLFMDMPGNDRVRISPERLSPEAIELSKEGKSPREVKAANVEKTRELLKDFGIEPDEVPPWLGDYKPTGQVWSGVDSVVIELQHRPGMPEVVLKVKRTPLDGQRWYEADIYDAKGKVNPRAVHETTDGGGAELYMFLEGKCDCNSAEPGLAALQQKLEARGIAIEPGSGPPFGFDLNTKKWVVVDRDSSVKRGKGGQDPENSGLGTEELDRLRLLEDEAAGKDRYTGDEGYGEVDGVDQYRGREAVDAIKLNERERAAVEKAFGKENAVEKLQALMQQMMDGLSSRNDVQILQTIVVNGGSAAKTQAQMAIAAEIAVGLKLPNLNSWVKRYATGTK